MRVPAAVVPNKKAKGFALIRSKPTTDVPHINFLVPTALYPLPATGKLIDSNLTDCVVRVKPTAGFRDGQLDYTGVRRRMGAWVATAAPALECCVVNASAASIWGQQQHAARGLRTRKPGV